MKVTARVSATNMPSSSKGSVQIVLRDGAGPDYSCDNNAPKEGYAFVLDFGNDEAELRTRKGCNNDETEMSDIGTDTSTSLSVGTTYEIVAIADGSSLTFYLDGSPVVWATDSTWTSGSVGFYCYHIDCSLDYIMIEVREL